VLECLKLPNAKVSKCITFVDHKGMCGPRSVTMGTKYFEGEKDLKCSKLSNVEVPKWIKVIDHEGCMALYL
jgi:hypothetical protein